MEIKNIEKFVRQVLQEDIKARDNDHLLYSKVILKIRPEISMSNFKHIFENYSDYCLPPFESISRCRRKIQNKGEYLSTITTYDARKRKIQEYIDYAITEGGI